MLVLFYKHKSNLGMTWTTVLCLGITFLPFLCEMGKQQVKVKRKIFKMKKNSMHKSSETCHNSVQSQHVFISWKLSKIMPTR